MTFKEGLVAARSHLIFLAGFLASIAIIVAIERWERDPTRRYGTIPYSRDIPVPAPAPLTAEERGHAEVAWRYIAVHTRPETGLADPVAGNRATTLWNIGSHILAVRAAETLGLVGAAEAEQRVGRVIEALGRLPLFDGALPSRFHDTASLQPVTHAGQPTTGADLGWSAIDLGRLLNALDLWGRSHPAQLPAVTALLQRWDVARAVDGRELQAARPDGDGKAERHQEGRLGYEEYAAKGFQLLGYDLTDAMAVRPTLVWIEVDGVEVPVDERAMGPGTRTHTLSEPWMADGLEYGWDRTSRELAWRIYLVQEKHFARTGRMTAAGEGPLDRAPWFAQSTILAGGRPWRTLDDRDEDAPGLRTVSVKAAFGWHALFRTSYSERLRASVAGQFDPDKGWYAGVYEADGTANKALTLETNAGVLEALAFGRGGPLRPLQTVARR